MKQLRILSAVALTALILAGCDGGTKEQFGTVIGAGVGALAGSQIGDGRGQLAAVAVGTLLGAIAGSQVGKSLDHADRLAMANAQQQALETGKSGANTTWRNPDSGNSGAITPQPAYQEASGRHCREFQQAITVAGKTESAYGTACRQPDGTWRII